MRLELKHFQRHVMTQSILRQEEFEGWPGEIHDSKVVDSGEPEDAEDTGDEPQGDEDDAQVNEDEPDDSDGEVEPQRAARAGRSRNPSGSRRKQGGRK
jgi:hypothetical protein